MGKLFINGGCSIATIEIGDLPSFIQSGDLPANHVFITGGYPQIATLRERK